MALRWFGDRVAGLARRAGRSALDRAGREMVREVRARLSVPGHGVPSPPGRPPHLQTGELRASVRYYVDDARMFVAVVVDHPAASYLEFGTRTMPPRPYLRQTFAAYAIDRFPNQFRGLLGARHAPEATRL